MFRVLMKLYELTYLASPLLSEEEIKSLLSKISGFISETGGKMEKSHEPLRKKLAYPIKKQTEAFLISLDFRLFPDKLKELEKALKSEKEIIRYIILNKKEVKEKPASRKPFIPPSPEVATEEPAKEKKEAKPQKVELKEIDKKIEEILKD